MTEYYVQVNDNGFEITEIFWSVASEVAHQGIIPLELGTHHAVSGEDMIATLRKRFQPAQFINQSLNRVSISPAWRVRVVPARM